MSRPTADEMVRAAVALLPRLGCSNFELRYSEPEIEGSPIVWVAIATFASAPHQVGAGLQPASACYKLLEQLVDGGHCLHCRRPTGISDDFTAAMPASQQICWYQYDPELKRFRRGCEGGPT